MEQGLSRLGRVAQRLLEKAAGLLPTIAAAVMVLVVSWALAGLARQAARFGTRYVESPTRRNLIRQLAHYTVTGIGLGGGALGFALKDSLSNFVSGLLILLSRTFEINDQIVVGETEGTVERIEFRATHIRTYDGRLVPVPNGESSRRARPTTPHRRSACHGIGLRRLPSGSRAGVGRHPPDGDACSWCVHRTSGFDTVARSHTGVAACRGPVLDRLEARRLRAHGVEGARRDRRGSKQRRVCVTRPDDRSPAMRDGLKAVPCNED